VNLYGEQKSHHPLSTTITTNAHFPISAVGHLSASVRGDINGTFDIPVSEDTFNTYLKPFMDTQQFCERFGDMIAYIHAPDDDERRQRERLIGRWKFDTRERHPVGALIAFMRKRNLIKSFASCLAENAAVDEHDERQQIDHLTELLQHEYPVHFMPAPHESRFHWKRAAELVVRRRRLGHEPFRKLAAYAEGDWRRSPRE
jgi:hypothetical protein